MPAVPARRSRTPASTTAPSTATGSPRSPAPSTRSGTGRSRSPPAPAGDAAAPVTVRVDAAAPSTGCTGCGEMVGSRAAHPAALRRRRQRQRHRREFADALRHRPRRPRRHLRARARDPARRQRGRDAATTTARSPSTSPRSTRSTTRSSRSRHPADRRAVVHAGRDRPRPARDGLRLPRHHLAAGGLVRVARSWSPRWPRTWSSATASTRSRTWAFEVWNEPNLEVFWTGTQAGLPAAVRRVGAGGQGRRRATARRRPVDRRRRVDRGARRPRRDGATCRSTSSPRHTYGNLPLDVRPALRPARLRRHPDLVDGVGRRLDALRPDPRRRHRRAVRAERLPRACRAGMDALAYWVISDHFEELGRPPRLFHNGFGLLTVGNLRKPRYWAVHLAAHQGDEVLAHRARRRRRRTCSSGPGRPARRRHGRRAGVERHHQRRAAWTATRAWTATCGSPSTGSTPAAYQVRLARVDEHHSNIVGAYPADVDWPDASLWQRLHDADRLHEERLPDVDAAGDGSCALRVPPADARRRPDPPRRRVAPRPATDEENHDETPSIPSPSAPAMACAAVAALVALGASACSSAPSATAAHHLGRGRHAHHPGRRRQPVAGGELQPVLAATELHGTYLIYEPLEIPSPVDGTLHAVPRHRLQVHQPDDAGLHASAPA